MVGMITDCRKDEKRKIWKNGATVQKARGEFGNEDVNAASVQSTTRCNYIDKYHYDTEGFIDLGKEFARALHKLESSEEAEP